MMENESMREPKNTMVMVLAFMVVVAVILAIVGFVRASGFKRDAERLTGEKEVIRQEAEQLKQECLRKMDEAEALRKTAMEWTRQHQLQVQEEMRKKADEAAKQAQLKADQAAKAAVKSPAKSSTTTTKKSSSTPAKKSTAKKTTTKKST
jgi:biopolymer transport protein ExbB/TolQ